MKKTKSILGKVMVIAMSITFILMIGGSIPSNTNANSDGALAANNVQLRSENFELKKKYAELQKELLKMEDQIEKIYEYDNVVYSQILGVDFDTTNFGNYRNDSANYILMANDSIFSELTERSRYAAEMLALQLIKLQETSSFFKTNKSAINYYPTISPIKTKDFVNLSSPYGWRMHPIDKKMIFHEGVDIAAKPGTNVYATAQGRVVKILYSKYGYGNRVVIKHAYGFETLYAHLGLIKVKKGQWLRKNQLIGTVGNTGKSTGPHLHYEIHKHNETRDPLGYFYTHITNELLVSN